MAGLSWPLPEGLDDASLEQQLFPPPCRADSVSRPTPNWATIHQELKHKGFTLGLLWEEYKATCPEDGFQYSWFCRSYRDWAGLLDLSMRQHHKAGVKLFVDYAGQTAGIVNPATGGGARCSDLRRGARCLKLHLRRGYLDAIAPRLDQLAHPRPGVLWRRHRDPGARQSEVGGDQAPPL